MALRRINHELQEINKSNQTDHQNIIFSVAPVGSDLFKWNGFIFGPQGSPYQNGIFRIEITFPNNYPFRPPHIVFQTRICHPNISVTGAICLDILKDKWSPVLTISKVLMSISSLLTDPNPYDPLNHDAAELYLEDKQQFNLLAIQWTKLYATI